MLGRIVRVVSWPAAFLVERTLWVFVQAVILVFVIGGEYRNVRRPADNR